MIPTPEPLIQQELLRRDGVSLPAVIVAVVRATVILTPAVMMIMMDVRVRMSKLIRARGRI